MANEPPKPAVEGKAAAKPPRRQHVVPDFYLRRFADPSGRVVMTDKRDGRRLTTSVDAVMVIKDFYTVETTSGKSYEVEDWLSDLEGRAAAIMRRIDGGEFPLESKEDRDILAVYIAYQLARGREFHDLVESAAQAMTEAMTIAVTSHPEAMRAALEGAFGTKPSDVEVEEQRISLREALEQKRITTTVPRSMAVGEMLAIAPELAQLIAQRSWILLRSETARFITSDVPVGMIGGTFPDGRRMPIGVMTATEISFPTDSHTCILMDKPKQAEGIVHIDEDVVLTLNARQHLMARRFTFQHPDDRFVFDQRAAAAAREAPQSRR